MSGRTPDKKLDTITNHIGFGVQVESIRALTTHITPSGFYPAHGLRLHVFSASDRDEDGFSPAEAASVYLSKEQTDKLIATLQEHRARMEPEVVPGAVVTP